MKTMELGPEELAVIEAAREGAAPSELERARVRRGLDAKLAAGVAAPVLATTTAFALSLKIGVGVALAAAVGGGVFYAAGPHETASPSTSPPRRALRASPPPEVPPAVDDSPAERPATPVQSTAAAPAARTRPAGRSSTHAVNARRPEPTADLAGELALLTQANAATKAGDAARAAALLAAYDRAYPTGQLTQERAAAGILALCAAGHLQVARAKVRLFLERWPTSPLVARLRSSCAGSDARP